MDEVDAVIKHAVEASMLLLDAGRGGDTALKCADAAHHTERLDEGEVL